MPKGTPAKVNKAIQEIGNQVSPTAEGETEVQEPEPAKRQRWVPSERRKQVANLWYKGYLNQDIAKKLGLTPKQVSDDLKVVKKLLEPKTIRAIEYYRNRARHQLDMIRQAAWELVENEGARHGARVAALRLIKDVEELSVKVDGVVSEKMPAGPDKKAAELDRRLIAIAKGNGGDGHKDVEVSEVAATD